MPESRPHTLRNFDADLSAFCQEVTLIGNLAFHALTQARTGLLERSLEVCNAVVAEDEAIDQLEKHIDELGMAILIRYTPMASDLRLVISSLNATRNLERIADHAVNIAKRARKILKQDAAFDGSSSQELFGLAEKVFSGALQAYEKMDAKLALQVIEQDKEVDRLYKQLSKELTAQISSHSAQAEGLLHLIFIVRSLERVADLAVNLAEDIVFISSAKDIRHTS